MDLFSGLDLTVMGAIADSACAEASYSSGTVIFKEGDSAATLFILVDGVVELQIGGRETVYRLTEESDIFGWSSLVEGPDTRPRRLRKPPFRPWQSIPGK